VLLITGQAVDAVELLPMQVSWHSCQGSSILFVWVPWQQESCAGTMIFLDNMGICCRLCGFSQLPSKYEGILLDSWGMTS